MQRFIHLKRLKVRLSRRSLKEASSSPGGEILNTEYRNGNQNSQRTTGRKRIKTAWNTCKNPNITSICTITHVSYTHATKLVSKTVGIKHSDQAWVQLNARMTPVYQPSKRSAVSTQRCSNPGKLTEGGQRHGGAVAFSMSNASVPRQDRASNNYNNTPSLQPTLQSSETTARRGGA